MQVFVCRSGSAADTQNISAFVAHYLRQHEMDVGGEPDVATAANIAMQIVYNNKARSWQLHASQQRLSRGCRAL